MINEEQRCGQTWIESSMLKKKSREWIPDGAKAEGHEQQDSHDTHGSLVIGGVAALKQHKQKKNRL